MTKFNEILKCKALCYTAYDYLQGNVLRVK